MLLYSQTAFISSPIQEIDARYSEVAGNTLKNVKSEVKEESPLVDETEKPIDTEAEDDPEDEEDGDEGDPERESAIMGGPTNPHVATYEDIENLR